MSQEPDLLTRRHFLRTSILGAALSWTVPVFVERTFSLLNAEAAESTTQIATGKDHPILVLLQLAGGNDGLNAIVPFADDLYYRARPTINIPHDQVLSLDGYVGFNPRMAPLKNLFDQGKLAVIQGVGYPNPNRSHFRSTEIWQTASDANKYLKTGWIGRYFDNCCPGEDPTVGVTIGSQLPQTFTAEKSTGIAMTQSGRLGFGKEADPSEQQVFNELNGITPDHDLNSGASIGSINGPNEPTRSPVEYLQRTALDAQVGTEKIEAVLKRAKAEAVYPKTPLGNELSLIARLLSGGLPTRVYYASQGGYDTHNAQENSHNNLLGQLADVLMAFSNDLTSKGIWDRVLVMTFSEFGRRVAENASKGTDHGTAAPMFVSGGIVKPGVYGKHPSLSQLDQGDLIHTVDFRSVYATVLNRWMKAPAAKILGQDFSPLSFV
jgi:uncharacterized protein (DUF1501 family)